MSFNWEDISAATVLKETSAEGLVVAMLVLDHVPAPQEEFSSHWTV